MITLLAATIMIMMLLDETINRSINSDIPWHSRPFTWLAIPWLASSTLLALPIIQHQEVIRIDHIIFISGCILAFLIGTLIPTLSGKQKNSKKPVPETESTSNRLYYGLAIAGFIGHAASIADSIQVSGISIVERFSSSGLTATRAALFASQAIGQGGRFSALEPLSAFSFVFIICHLTDVFNKRERAKKFQPKAIFLSSCLLIIFNALVISGGRMNVLLLLMTLIAALSLDKTKYLITKIKAAPTLKKVTIGLALFISGLTTIATLSTTFVEARMDGTPAEFLINQSHRAKINPIIDELTRDHPSLRYGLFTLSYFTVPIPTLTYYLDLPDAQFPGPFWGQYNFPGISDNIMRRTGTSLYVGWGQARADVFNALMMYGYGGNVWSTMLRDLSVDFTKVGTMFFMLFFGWISQRTTISAYHNQNPFVIASAAAMLVMLGYSVLHSLFYIQTIWGLLYYSAIAYFITSFLNRFRVNRKNISGAAL